MLIRIHTQILSITAALLTLLTNMTAMSQPTYRITKDTTDGGLIYNGRITLGNLEKEPSFTWYTSGRDNYKPEQKALDVLKFYLAQYKMIVFLGTWCDDSHTLIPKLASVLQLTGYPQDKLVIYGVDRSKTTLGGEQKTYEITNVPTIILVKDEMEAGRITESVATTIEGDLSKIIEDDMTGQTPH